MIWCEDVHGFGLGMPKSKTREPHQATRLDALDALSHGPGPFQLELPHDLPRWSNIMTDRILLRILGDVE